MRICLVHNWVGGEAGGGGGSRLMLDLGLTLQALGHSVTVACHDFEPGTEFRSASEELDVRSIRAGPFRTEFGRRAALRRFWRQMPKVAGLIPSDVEIVNAHEWPALHAARLAASR